MIPRRTVIVKRIFGWLLLIGFVSLLVSGFSETSYLLTVVWITAFVLFILLLIWLFGGFEKE
jgi:amino acid permease